MLNKVVEKQIWVKLLLWKIQTNTCEEMEVVVCMPRSLRASRLVPARVSSAVSPWVVGLIRASSRSFLPADLVPAQHMLSVYIFLG